MPLAVLPRARACEGPRQQRPSREQGRRGHADRAAAADAETEHGDQRRPSRHWPPARARRPNAKARSASRTRGAQRERRNRPEQRPADDGGARRFGRRATRQAFAASETARSGGHDCRPARAGEATQPTRRHPGRARLLRRPARTQLRPARAPRHRTRWRRRSTARPSAGAPASRVRRWRAQRAE